jgi:hypothetical protein
VDVNRLLLLLLSCCKFVESLSAAKASDLQYPKQTLWLLLAHCKETLLQDWGKEENLTTEFLCMFAFHFLVPSFSCKGTANEAPEVVAAIDTSNSAMALLIQHNINPTSNMLQRAQPAPSKLLNTEFSTAASSSNRPQMLLNVS